MTKYNPSINEDRIKKLREKWVDLLDFSPEAMEKCQTQLATAIMVEPHETWVKSK